MYISSFDDLLTAARAQPDPQRLLFVFAATELPDDATPAERARFHAGQGGALVPVMCVDKSPQELPSFDALVREASLFAGPGQDWSMVFAAALAGKPGKELDSAAAEAPLQRMVENIKQGGIGAYIPFDRHGQPVEITSR